MTTVADTRPAVRTDRRLSHPVAFAAIAAVFVTFAAASAAPSPLYVVYQQQWGFTAWVLTVVVAVYVIGLLGSLLVVGALSDHVGRRPVLAAAIALEATSLALFLTAGDVTVLLVARLLQGIATGAALTTLGAALVDLNPPHAPGRAGLINGIAPVAGLAVGALGCGALVQFAPEPTHLVWALLLGAMALAFVAVLALPEPSARRPGVMRSLVARLGVPHRFRGDVYVLMPVIVASWALGGLYLSLGPSVAVTVFGVTSHFFGGLVVVLLCGTGAVTAFVLRGWPAPVVLRISMTTLAAGTALTLAGMLSGSVAAALAGTVVSGIGYGASGLAAFGSMARIAGPADPAERGELFAVAYTVAFLAFSLPAVAAGYATTRIGLPATVAVYSVLVIVIAVAAFAVQEARSARRGRTAPR